MYTMYVCNTSECWPNKSGPPPSIDNYLYYASKNNVTHNDLKYKISEKSFIDVNCLHLYPQIKVTFGSF